MVKICQTRLLKLNVEIIPKKRIFRFLPKISAGHAWSWKFLFANFQILGPLGCQGWVVIPQNVKKSQNHCTLVGSLILFSLFGKFTAGIDDTAPVRVAKFTAVVVDTGVKLATGVPDTGGVPWPNFWKFWNDPNVIFRGLGEDDSWKKNMKGKISWHCPFKTTAIQCVGHLLIYSPNRITELILASTMRKGIMSFLSKSSCGWVT